LRNGERREMPGTLNPGESLGPNQELRSNNGRYYLVMQSDGNLVLYEGAASTAIARWDTGTWGLDPDFQPVRADMQQDGNFVLYSATGDPVWATGTDGYGGSRLVMQDDRNLVIYDPANRPLWATNTEVEVLRPTEPFNAGQIAGVILLSGLLLVATSLITFRYYWIESVIATAVFYISLLSPFVFGVWRGLTWPGRHPTTYILMGLSIGVIGLLGFLVTIAAFWGSAEVVLGQGVYDWLTAIAFYPLLSTVCFAVGGELGDVMEARPGETPSTTAVLTIASAAISAVGSIIAAILGS
jgi:hypothetical protein